ncbi:SAM-dependent chlorinase/fluorinase [Lyngbya sp. CCY1209]|uniref:SAM hydrolase/SAM-dependent halogenase family protein n=1 Tax=Lyngbya sp. CCY1209 TaxID=2886103 RepID=UPI002D213B27|nr:SAM-dependent chlorinase/fluorinase [Lyngbya sp. CCY1209]MEB3884777.1 S-adenosyl-l-methionine hydroxide adenosyltransferase family protein [Lyngbya sp. CCY1209]
MSPSRIVTLLTDFGLNDVYVGIMKGVVAQIDPTLTVIDLTHEIPPQNIIAGRFCLINAYPYFPEGTVHVAVIDPGVGTRRRAIAIQLSTGYLVGPDNGLLGGLIKQQEIITAIELNNPDYWRTPNPSTTFHGRDIFTPAGAHLARGVPIEKLGTPIDRDTLADLSLPDPKQTKNIIAGCIQHIDRFGNLITNIPGDRVAGTSWTVTFPTSPRPTVIPSRKTYGDIHPGSLLTLIGSHGWVEIAANGDSAQLQLELNWGAKVEIHLDANSTP